MFLRRTFLVASLVWSALLTASVGAAQPAVDQARLPLALQITTVEGCPAQRFQGALEARVRRPFEIQPGAASVLRVSLVGAGAGVVGTASFSGASGQATRSIGGSCDEVTAALALVATTWLEAERVEPATATPSAVGPATTAPAAPDAPGPAQTTPRPRFAVGAHGVATFGLTDGPAAGAGLAFAYQVGRLELRGGLRGALGGETIAAGNARYRWLTVPLDGCFHLANGRSFSLAGCGRAEPGLFYASFGGADRPLPWISLGAPIARRMSALLGVSNSPIP